MNRCYFCHKEITPDTIGYFTFDFFPEPVDHVCIDGVGKFYICGECLDQVKANEGPTYEMVEALYQGYAMMEEGGDDIIDVEPVKGGEMARPYLTISQYSRKYGVPNRTVRDWVNKGILEAMKCQRPILIPDDQPIPRKDPDIHRWRYQWKKS